MEYLFWTYLLTRNGTHLPHTVRHCDYASSRDEKSSCHRRHFTFAVLLLHHVFCNTTINKMTTGKAYNTLYLDGEAVVHLRFADDMESKQYCKDRTLNQGWRSGFFFKIPNGQADTEIISGGHGGGRGLAQGREPSGGEVEGTGFGPLHRGGKEGFLPPCRDSIKKLEAQRRITQRLHTKPPGFMNQL
jgi:hypothetical protein